MASLKAYSVLEKDEYTGGIYFAAKAIYAAKWGANEYADGELGGVQCRRAPWADPYFETGVPAHIAVDHGWRFECYGCGITVDSDLGCEHGLPISGICGKVSGAVYCSARCKWRQMREDARRKEAEQDTIDDFKKIVLARFPDADFADDEDQFRSHHAYVTRSPRSGFWHRRQVAVSFRFPGMEIAPANFRMEDYHKIGPPKAYYTCCNGDREAFEAYAAATKRRAA